MTTPNGQFTQEQNHALAVLSDCVAQMILVSENLRAVRPVAPASYSAGITPKYPLMTVLNELGRAIGDCEMLYDDLQAGYMADNARVGN